ncbi:MAG: DUF192 domain-containing protein, partial [Hadesarchaea archaeon]|nr:DUF192 domain-containing protein [Hadesarchaea archaeon]
DKALVFILSEPKRYSIHTFFMFFPIDLIYLNEDFEVIEIKKGLSPWSTYKSSEKASFLIEFSSGRVNEVDVNMGDELKLGDKGQRG